jgi:DNA-binding transcriptional MerR regulator
MEAFLEPIKLSKSRFDQQLRDYHEALEHPDFCNVFLAMCNGSETLLLAFDSTRGVGITAFSRLMKLPVTTVRHYVELGLINPMSVNGKFYFTPFNVPQVESVRQWRELGLRLEEILDRRRKLGNTIMLAEQGSTPITINGQTQLDVTVQILRHQSPEEFERNQSEMWAQRNCGTSGMVLEQDDPVFSNLPALREDLRIEYAQVIEKLEQKKLEIEQKLEKAKKLRKNLEPYSPVANPV